MLTPEPKRHLMETGSDLGRQFNKRMTQSLVELVGLSPRCQQFTDYWFSVWEDDRLPTPRLFAPEAIPKLRPFILTMLRSPNGATNVTSLGSEIIQAGCADLLGTDWISHAPLD